MTLHGIVSAILGGSAIGAGIYGVFTPDQVQKGIAAFVILTNVFVLTILLVALLVM